MQHLLSLNITVETAQGLGGAAEKFYDQNTGTWKKFWFGSQSAYNLLTPAADTVYFITGA